MAPKKRKQELNERQRAFAAQYIVDFNATQAAIRAGYSKKTAGQQGFELLKKPEIQEAIASAIKARSKRTEITQDRVLQELASLGFSSIQNVVDENGQMVNVQDWDKDTAQAVSSVEVVQKPSGEYDEDGNPIYENVHKIRLWDKLSALEKLGKHLGMFVDRSEQTVFNVTIDGDDAKL